VVSRGFLPPAGTVEFFSEITISSSFTAEYAENAEASENLNVDWKVLKLCALGDLRGDKSLVFYTVPPLLYKYEKQISSCGNLCNLVVSQTITT
jgi:hypothetical protein